MRKLRSVLYVDDDPDICAVVQATLSLIGKFSVDVAGSGDMAIRLAVQRQPDLILMDVMMPDLDGPSTLRHLRADPRTAVIPIIFLTAKVLPGEVAQLTQLGALGVIAKPFDPTHLCANIQARWESQFSGSETAAREGSELRAATAEISALDVEFIARARKDAVRLREMLARAVAGELAALGEVERVAHSIHGTAAMFGLPSLSDCGGLIEKLAERAIGAAAQAEHETYSRLLQELIEGTTSFAAAVSAAEADRPRHAATPPCAIVPNSHKAASPAGDTQSAPG